MVNPVDGCDMCLLDSDMLILKRERDLAGEVLPSTSHLGWRRALRREGGDRSLSFHLYREATDQNIEEHSRSVSIQMAPLGKKPRTKNKGASCPEISWKIRVTQAGSSKSQCLRFGALSLCHISVLLTHSPLDAWRAWKWTTASLSPGWVPWAGTLARKGETKKMKGERIGSLGQSKDCRLLGGISTALDLILLRKVIGIYILWLYTCMYMLRLCVCVCVYTLRSCVCMYRGINNLSACWLCTHLSRHKTHKTGISALLLICRKTHNNKISILLLACLSFCFLSPCALFYHFKKKKKSFKTVFIL